MMAWAKPLQALTFSLAQADENGNFVEGGHSAEAVNDAEGKIVFDGITYGPRNIAGTYWYQMTEKSSDELAAIYRMDKSVKTIKVVLQKGAEGRACRNGVTDGFGLIVCARSLILQSKLMQVLSFSSESIWRLGNTLRRIVILRSVTLLKNVLQSSGIVPKREGTQWTRN